MNQMERTKSHVAIIANMCSLIPSFVTGRGADGAVSFRVYAVIGCCLSFGALEMQMSGSEAEVETEMAHSQTFRRLSLVRRCPARRPCPIRWFDRLNLVANTGSPIRVKMGTSRLV